MRRKTLKTFMASFNFYFFLCKCHGKDDHVLIFILLQHREKKKRLKIQTFTCLELKCNNDKSLLAQLFLLNSSMIYSKSIYVNCCGLVRVFFFSGDKQIIGHKIHIIPSGLNFFLSSNHHQISTKKKCFLVDNNN